MPIERPFRLDRRAVIAARRASHIKLGAVLGVALLLTSCSTGPATKQELCDAFDVLGTKMLQANGVFDNGVFRQAGKVGGLADRYQETDLSRDAKRLKDISDSTSTDGQALMSATAGIADVCGHPLGLNLR